MTGRHSRVPRTLAGKTAQHLHLQLPLTRDSFDFPYQGQADECHYCSFCAHLLSLGWTISGRPYLKIWFFGLTEDPDENAMYRHKVLMYP